MQAAHTSAPTKREARASNGERTCLVTGVVRPKDELIRFVIGPDHTVVPDLAQNLPGRGLWVTADRATIDEAAHKNLFARAAKTSLKADPELVAFVAVLLKKRCLEFLGLAKGAGIATLGQTQVEAALKGNKIALLLIADDAKSDLKRDAVTTSRVFTRNELGAALGYDQLVYVGLKSHGLTDKLRYELMRLDKIAGKGHIFMESGDGNS